MTISGDTAYQLETKCTKDRWSQYIFNTNNATKEAHVIHLSYKVTVYHFPWDYLVTAIHLCGCGLQFFRIRNLLLPSMFSHTRNLSWRVTNVDAALFNILQHFKVCPPVVWVQSHWFVVSLSTSWFETWNIWYAIGWIAVGFCCRHLWSPVEESFGDPLTFPSSIMRLISSENVSTTQFNGLSWHLVQMFMAPSGWPL